MQSPESTLPHTYFDTLPRRRRTSLSGKFFNLFSVRPKSLPAAPPRPVISLPQPLPSRIPIRQKRNFRQVSVNENDPPPSSPRPRSRLRLASDASVDTLGGYGSPEKMHIPPRRDQTVRPLKSALKKSASENDSNTGALLTAVGVTQAVTTSSAKSKEPRILQRLRNSNWIPLPHHNHHSPAPTEVGSAPPTPLSPTPRHQSQQKHVTFAMDSSRRVLTRTPSMHQLPDSLSDDGQEDIAMELDIPIVDPSSPSNARKTEDHGDLRYGPLPPLSGSSIMSRNQSALVPSQTPLSARHTPNNKRKARLTSSTRKNKHVHFRAMLPQQAPPLPSVFELPPPQSTRTRMGGIMDEVLKDHARTMNANFHPVVTKRGPAGVLQRISIDIVPNERHTTLWDVEQQDTYAWGGALLVRDAKPASYFYPRHCIQDLRIEFYIHDEPTSSPTYSSGTSTPPEYHSEPNPVHSYSWRTSYTGQRLKRTDILTRLDASRGISVEPEYVFVQPADPEGPCAWLVHFWVPIPLQLLMSEREICKTFVCRARVTVGDWETPKTEVPAGCTSVTIECLRSERMLGMAVGPSAPQDKGAAEAAAVLTRMRPGRSEI